MQLPETVTAVCKRMPGADKPVRARQRVLAGVGAGLNYAASEQIVLRVHHCGVKYRTDA
jgi:hypothetical protein